MWAKHAVCSGKTALFFRHSCTNKCITHPAGCSRVKSVRDCKSICSRCPVLEFCRKWAIHDNLEVGVAGGMTELERLWLKSELEGEEIDE